MRLSLTTCSPILILVLAFGIACPATMAQEIDATSINFDVTSGYIATYDNTGVSGGAEMGLWYGRNILGEQFLEFDGFGDRDVSIFRINADSPRLSLAIDPDGVGLGTLDPTAPLHVRQPGSAVIRSESVSTTVTPRLGLDMINNGGVFFNMDDKSITGAQWQIANFGNSFSLKKAGGGPGMVINPVGQVRFVTPTTAPSPNFIIETNGDIFARGTIRSNGPVIGGSDRNTKENIRDVDPSEILAKVVEMPITTWNYIHDEENLPHMGPMAQDFYAAFGLGQGDKTIAYMDKDGVALAAIQGLHQSLEARDETVAELTDLVKAQQKALETQQEELAEMRELVERLEAVVAIPVEQE
jgi:hypothetical protein